MYEMGDAESAHGSTRYNPSVPIQYQIFLDLKKQLEEGLWIGRDDFPGAKELAELYNVSRITAEGALERLVDAGWIERSRGRRPRVMRVPAEPVGEMPGWLKTGRHRPFEYELLHSAVDVAPTDACHAFGLDPGSRMWIIRRLRRWAGKPHSVTFNVQPETVGASHRVADLNAKPMVRLLAGQRRPAASAVRQMAIQPASNFEAHALEISLGQATLAATFTMFGEDERVVQWVRIQLHPEARTPVETFDMRAGTGWLSDDYL
jgi:GntR family transcriptional regulator